MNDRQTSCIKAAGMLSIAKLSFFKRTSGFTWYLREWNNSRRCWLHGLLIQLRTHSWDRWKNDRLLPWQPAVGFDIHRLLSRSQCTVSKVKNERFYRRKVVEAVDKHLTRELSHHKFIYVAEKLKSERYRFTMRGTQSFIKCTHSQVSSSSKRCTLNLNFSLPSAEKCNLSNKSHTAWVWQRKKLWEEKSLKCLAKNAVQ